MRRIPGTNGSLTGDDIWRIAELVAARDSKLRVPEGVDAEAVADHLHAAFDNAMRSDLLAERSNDAGRLKGPWFQRLNRDAQRLIKTLGLTPEQCMDASRPLPEGWELPAICHLQAAADEMPGILWPHAAIVRALSGLPRIGQRMEAAERAFKDRGEPWDYRTQQNIYGRLTADLLLDCLPGTLGLVATLATWAAETQPQRPRGAQSDVLRRELFCVLAGAHESMFGRGPRSRTKTGTRDGASVYWVRLVLSDATERLPDACGHRMPNPGEQVGRIEAIRGLADRTDDTLTDWLEQGWSAWKRRSERIRERRGG